MSDLARRYDEIMYVESATAYFRGSDFTNFGLWTGGPQDQKEACERLMERLLELVPPAAANVLDVACGKGGTTAHLLTRFASRQVAAINISQRQIRSAARNAPGCGFAVMDAARLGFAAESFDVVLCVEAAFHFRTRADFLREVLRILRPGGRLILTDILMNREAERRRPFRHEENYVASLAAYRALCERIGFVKVAVEDYTDACWRGCYWHAVRYFHDRYFAGEIDLPALKSSLKLTYDRARDIEHYLLAILDKAPGASADRAGALTKGGPG